MRKIKTMLIITMFLLMGLGLSPLINSNEIIEQTQRSGMLLTSTLEIEDDKTDSIIIV